MVSRCGLVAVLLALGSSPGQASGGPIVSAGGVYYFQNGCCQSFCTLGVALKGSDRRTYLTTAGHCMGAATTADVFTADGSPFGAFVWHEDEDTVKGSRDFALIRVNEGVEVDPTIAGLGGPRTILDSSPPPGTRVAFTGHGIEAVPQRGGVVLLESHTDEVAEFTSAPVWFGDSGAAVLTCDGQAVGTIRNIGSPSIWYLYGIPPERTPSPGQTQQVPLLSRSISRAEQALDLRLDLIPGEDMQPTIWC